MFLDFLGYENTVLLVRSGDRAELQIDSLARC